MIRIFEFDALKPEEILNRDIRAEASVEATVDAIIADVRARGDAALKDYALKFDHAQLDELRVSQAEIDEAFEAAGEDFVTTLKMAAANIRAFHEHQVHKNFVMNDTPGIVLGQKYTPIEKAGVYVPGGTAAYPSTVLMDVIPAKVAGVKEIVMTTPAGPDGKVNPSILAAAVIAGIDKIFKTGGAQAVAAMAFGTATIPRVGKIFGPGNAYVTEAKRQVSSRPDGAAIDMPAGPSEVLVIADEGADPAFVAADLLSQAEHGPDSQVVLVTPSRKLAEAVAGEVASQLAALPRREIATKALSASRLILVKDLEACVEVSNRYAPEHLIIQTRNARDLVPLVQNAGSVFVGDWSPESGGDYATGTNHVLPTYGYAATYSSLGLADFTKRMTVQEMTPQGFEKLGPAIALLAHAEELDAHMNAVLVRMDRIKQSKE